MHACTYFLIMQLVEHDEIVLSRNLFMQTGFIVLLVLRQQRHAGRIGLNLELTCIVMISQQTGYSYYS